MLKSCKRIFRIIDRNGGSNSVSSPKEILEIPVPTFTYHPLSKHLFQNSQSLSTLDPEYSHRSLHFVIENFSQCINLNLIFDKVIGTIALTNDGQLLLNFPIIITISILSVWSIATIKPLLKFLFFKIVLNNLLYIN